MSDAPQPKLEPPRTERAVRDRIHTLNSNVLQFAHAEAERLGIDNPRTMFGLGTMLIVGAIARMRLLDVEGLREGLRLLLPTLQQEEQRQAQMTAAPGRGGRSN